MEGNMAGLFSGLEQFGLKDTKELEVFETPKQVSKGGEGEDAAKKDIIEEDLIFDKSYKCPVCDKEFKSKMVRTGKVKMVSADLDLRPRYQVVDCLKYDAVLCPKCGYAALNRFFTFVLASQAKAIKEKISSSFVPMKDDSKVYDYDTAIARHKMALVNTVVKRGKNSEKAYTCLKIGWLLRGKREELLLGEYKKEEIDQLEAEELECVQNAFDGFNAAFSAEEFPMCGMDQYTVMYLIAELARRLGKRDDALRWISNIIVARDAQNRIKEKARDLKEMIVEAKK